MSQPFYYFIPNANGEALRKNAAGVLKSFGLDHLPADNLVFQNLEAPEPIKERGVLLRPRRADTSEALECRWRKDKQTWFKAGKIWIGLDNDAPPQPSDLLKSDQIATDGFELSDSNGRTWRIPVAEAFPASKIQNVTLPVDYVFQADGLAAARIKPQFDNLRSAATEAFEWFVNDKELTPERRASIAFTALRVNYEVTAAELNAYQAAGLALVDDHFASMVCQIICGAPIADEQEKKTE